MRRLISCACPPAPWSACAPTGTGPRWHLCWTAHLLPESRPGPCARPSSENVANRLRAGAARGRLRRRGQFIGGKWPVLPFTHPVDMGRPRWASWRIISEPVQPLSHRDFNSSTSSSVQARAAGLSGRGTRKASAGPALARTARDARRRRRCRHEIIGSALSDTGLAYLFKKAS